MLLHHQYQDSIAGSSTSSTEQQFPSTSSSARLAIQSSSDQQKQVDIKQNHQVIKSDIELGADYHIAFQLSHFTM